MKVEELHGAALAYAVLRARGYPHQKALRALVSYNKGKPYHPVTNADQAYALINELKIGTEYVKDKLWAAEAWPDTSGGFLMYGETMLIAVCRCYVRIKFGPDIAIPGELL